MNGYELSRIWFDWCFDNASKIRPIHTALFFFIIEHNNRLGWKKEFGLPRQMVMDAIGVKNNRTFTSAFEDLEKWGFITVFERSKNQYSANIISLYGYVENAPATTKAYDKALQKHSHKQSAGIAPIDKQLNNKTLNNKTLNDDQKNKSTTNGYRDDKAFIEDWNYARVKYLKVKASNIRTLTHYELINFRKANATYTIDEFRKGMEGLLMQKEIFDTMKLRPNHFLDEGNIDKYIDAFNNKKHLYKITSKDGRL